MTEDGRAGFDSELARERQTLARADLDIAQGTERLQRQRAVVLLLRTKGRRDLQAERLEQGLQATLAEWIRHRDLIRQRIAYLEHNRAAGGEGPQRWSGWD